MAAGLGFKDFTTGEVLTAADVDGYLMQGVWVFASAAARTSAVASPQEGNMSFLKDTNSLEYYSGAAWVAVAGASTPAFTGAVVYKSANQSISNGSWTLATWDSELLDTDGYHDNSTNNDRLTIPAGKAGKYVVTMNFSLNGGSSAVESYFGLNGAGSTLTYIGATGSGATKPFAVTREIYLNLSVGDWVNMSILQASGGAANLLGTIGHSYFSLEYLGA